MPAARCKNSLRGAAIAVAVFFLALARPGRASEGHESSSLSWLRLPGSETCIGSLELARAVEARIGRTVFASPAQATLAVEGRVNREDAAEGPRYHATITVTRLDGGVVGTRELATHGSSCRELDDVLVVVIALLIDPDAKEPEPAAPPAASHHVEVSIGPFVSLGMVPGGALGATAAFRLSLTPAWSLVAEGGTTLPRAKTDSGARFSFDDFDGALLGCGAVVRGSTRVDLCAGAEYDRLVATGNGTEQGQNLASLLAGATVAHALGRVVGLALDLRAGIPLARPAFSVGVLDAEALAVERRTIFRPAPVTGRVTARVGFRF